MLNGKGFEYNIWHAAKFGKGAVVVVQLVEQLLPTPLVFGSNPVIREIYIVNCIEETKIKKKEAGNGPFKINLEKWSRGVHVRWGVFAYNWFICDSETILMMQSVNNHLLCKGKYNSMADLLFY